MADEGLFQGQWLDAVNRATYDNILQTGCMCSAKFDYFVLSFRVIYVFMIGSALGNDYTKLYWFGHIFFMNMVPC